MSTSAHPVEGVLQSLNKAITHLRFYSGDHPTTQNSLEASYRELTKLLSERQETTLLRVDQELVWNEKPLGAESPKYARLMKDLEERGIESITFNRDLKREEFFGFLKEMARQKGGAIASCENIKFGRLLLRGGNSGAPPPTRPEEGAALSVFEELRTRKLEDLKDIYSQIVRAKKLNFKGVDDIISAFIKGFAYGVNPIRLLFEIRCVDEYTYTHMVNVCILTMSQAESLGFKGMPLYQIGVAAILHDAGKLLIPQDIINKPGRLTPEERHLIETHSAKGASFILSQKSIPKLAVIGALEHHIRFDGTGYPAINEGYRTNIVSQMIAIADVFDAMRSRRPYKEPRPVVEILKILQDGKGSAFNPLLVDNFMRLLAGAPALPDVAATPGA